MPGPTTSGASRTPRPAAAPARGTTFVDTGPLAALGLVREAAHEVCVRVAATLPTPLTTTWPAFAAAVYLLGSARGGQPGRWRLQERGDLVVADLSPDAARRASELLARYADVPMDLAHATLVALAEERGENRICTLDAGFHVYRLHGRRVFDVVPA